MSNTLALPSLDILLRSHQFPTLGEIVFASNGDRKKWKPLGLSQDEFHPRMWERYDQVFDHRADYRLWRLLFRPLHLPLTSVTWGTPLKIAEAGLESAESVIVWGILAVLAGLIASKRSKIFELNERLSLADMCDQRMSQGLEPIVDGEAGCGVVKVLILDAIDKRRYDARMPMTLEEIHLHYLRRLERYLQEIDPTWRPGKIPSLGQLQYERDKGRVVPLFRDIDILMLLSYPLFRTRGRIRSATYTIDGLSNELLKIAHDYAVSAWRTSRAVRLGEEKWLERERPRHPRLDMDRLLSDEMQALRRAAQAARDAGDYLLASGLGCLLLRIIPDHIRAHRRFEALGNDLAFIIRHAGLEVDGRFLWTRNGNAKNTQFGGLTYPTGRFFTEAKKESEIEDIEDEDIDTTDAPDPFRLRLIRDQEKDPRWAAILQYYPSQLDEPLVPLDRLVYDAVKGHFNEEETLHGAYQLSLKYGLIRYAGALIQHFAPSKIDLVDFAHSIKRALQIMPLGMDIELHEQWQDLLSNAWAALPDIKQITHQEALVVHEVLLGRYLTIVRNTGVVGAKLFAEKFYGAAKDAQIRAAFDTNHTAVRTGPATVIPERFQDFVLKSQDSDLGSPVCISIVSLGNDEWSILATGKSGRWISERVSLRKLLLRAQVLRTENYKKWLFQHPKSRIVEVGVAWGKEFKQLGKIIKDIMRDLNPRTRWLALALEPELSALPWQDLIEQTCGKNIVVSLIPSFSWAALSFQREDDSRRGISLELSQAEDLIAFRKILRRDKEALSRYYPSMAIILGHGQLTDKNIPSVVAAEQPLGLNEWMDMADHRIMVVHSCHSGAIQSSFLGDLGGLPGLALGICCRLFCAPVTEVPCTAAQILHYHLVEKNGPREFGLRYLAAISEAPAVKLYNLYGFADEHIKQQSSQYSR